MKIGGLLKFTLIDYPGKIAGVVFTVACNFRCPYCHNKGLVYPDRYPANMALEEVISFFEKRRRQLQGVVVSGGEPTLQDRLDEFAAELKSLGYSVKLDTNGSRPKVIKSLLEKRLVDYIAMDIKAPFFLYDKLSGCKVNISDIKKSIDIITSSGVEYHFRTTFAPPLTDEDIEAIKYDIVKGKKYIVQKYVPVRE